MGANYFVRASVLAEVGLFDETLPVGEMHDLALRVAARSAAVHLPEFYVDVLLTPRGLRHTVPLDEWRQCADHYTGRWTGERT